MLAYLLLNDYDGNIDYFSSKHLPLFIVAVQFLFTLFMAYTLFLLYGQWLQYHQEGEGFDGYIAQLIMMDAYHTLLELKHVPSNRTGE